VTLHVPIACDAASCRWSRLGRALARPGIPALSLRKVGSREALDPTYGLGYTSGKRSRGRWRKSMTACPRSSRLATPRDGSATSPIRTGRCAHSRPARCGFGHPPDRGRAIAYDRVPQIPDPKQIAVAQLVGAGFKPAPHAAGLLRQRSSSAAETKSIWLNSTSAVVNAERGRVGNPPLQEHPA
jgi:hypothetical protein